LHGDLSRTPFWLDASFRQPMAWDLRRLSGDRSRCRRLASATGGEKIR
jgi:hypothetical protein